MKKILSLFFLITTTGMLHSAQAPTAQTQVKPPELSVLEKARLEKIKADLKEILEKGTAANLPKDKIMQQIQAYLEAQKTLGQKLAAKFKKILFWTAISASILATAFFFIRYHEIEADAENNRKLTKQLIADQNTAIQTQNDLEAKELEYKTKIETLERQVAQNTTLTQQLTQQQTHQNAAMHTEFATLQKELSTLNSQHQAVVRERDQIMEQCQEIEKALVLRQEQLFATGLELVELKLTVSQHRDKYPKTWVKVMTPKGAVVYPKSDFQESSPKIFHTVNILISKMLKPSMTKTLHTENLVRFVISSMCNETIEYAAKNNEIDLQNTQDLDILPFSASLLPDVMLIQTND